MTLPKRVQAELQAAEALEIKIAEERSQAAIGALSSVAQLAIPPAVNEPPSDPQQVEPPPPPVPAPKEDFEHKYKTLQGMYDADVKQLRKQLRESVESLTAQIATLQKAKETPTEKPPVDPKDVENFGADLMEMITRYVDRKAMELEGRITALEQMVTGVTQQTAQTQEQQFYTLLAQLVPDWQEVNADPRWLAWLGEVDPVYGAPRQAALEAAHQHLDAKRTANVFVAFKASLPTPPAPSSLANQQAPSSAAPVAPPSVTQKPILSQKAITDFYADVRRGKYVGREAEADAIEADINLAVAEGRVR